MEAKLVIVSGASKSGEFKLKLPTIIGRSRTVDLPLGHSLVSRQHCKLYEDDGVLKLKDLGSLNGTYVGEERITEETVLLPGAQFTVGPVTFRAVYGEMPEADVSSSGFGDISDVILPPRASDELSSSGSIPASPPPAPPATKPSAKPPAAGMPEPTPPPPPPAAASELKTEELKPLAPGKAPEDFSLAEAPGSLDGPQFDWLNEAPADSATPSDTAESLDFTVDDTPPKPPGAGDAKAATPPVEKAQPAAKAKEAEAKKKPAKGGFFSRGGKAEKPKAPAAAKPKDKSPEPPAAAPAEPPAAAAAKPDETDELDFTLAPEKHDAPAKDADLENTLDFLK